MLGVELPLLLTLCLVLVNAFFVATEFAIVKVRSAHIEDLARRGSPLARVARKVINNLDTSLSAVQLGVTFASLGLGWIYYLGVAATAALLMYEHRLITPRDMSRINIAFFNVNSYIAAVLFLFTLLDALI